MKLIETVAALCLVTSVGACGFYFPTSPAPRADAPELIETFDSSISVKVSADRASLEDVLVHAVINCAEDKVNGPEVCLIVKPDAGFIAQYEESYNVILNHEDKPSTILGRKLYWNGSLWRFLDYDPVRLSWDNGRLRVTMPFRYHVALFLEYGGYRKIDSCGYGEPARRGWIDAYASVMPTPDWNLAFDLGGSFYPDPRFPSESECIVLESVFYLVHKIAKILGEDDVPAGIDLIPIIRGRISQEITKKMANKGNALSERFRFRERAEKVWRQLQEPIALGGGAWFQFRPSSADLSGLSYERQTDQIVVSASLKGRATVSSDSIVSVPPSPLPRLGSSPSDGRFRIALNVLIPYQDAATRLQELFARKYHLPDPFSFLHVEIRKLTLYPSAPSVVARVELAGIAVGHLDLIGTPKFERNSKGDVAGRIELFDLDYSPQTWEVLRIQGPATVKVATAILNHLKSVASFDIGPAISDLRAKAEAALNRRLDVHATLTTQFDDLALSNIILEPTQIHVVVLASGSSEVKVTP